MRADGKVRLVLLFVAIGVIAAIGVGTQFVGAPDSDPDLAEMGAPSSRSAVPATLEPAVAGAATPSAVAVTPAPTVSPSTAAPRPFVHDFAQGGTPRPPAPSPTAPVPFEWFRIDCDFAYGVRGQCISWSRLTEEERAAEDWCGYLARIGWTSGIVVPDGSPDPRNLDRNGDGVGCGDGDIA
jgi:hypothetical protein